tara:strand:+ start:1168 stop:1794 length:627 start_codon:yes stop_codon:yes gene_type:complete
LKILVDPKYDPTGKEITSKLKLASGISLAKFLGARGSRTQIKKLYNKGFNGPPDLNQIARNLVLHAQIMQSIIDNKEYANHRLIVSEGIYEPNPAFDLSGKYIGERPSGILDLRRTGQAVVYQLIDRAGATDPQKTFDLAAYWKDYIDYDKLTLDYDTFDPNGTLTCQIVIETPKVPESYEVSYKYALETTYNGELQTKNELLEILPD